MSDNKGDFPIAKGSKVIIICCNTRGVPFITGSLQRAIVKEPIVVCARSDDVYSCVTVSDIISQQSLFARYDYNFKQTLFF